MKENSQMLQKDCPCNACNSTGMQMCRNCGGTGIHQSPGGAIERCNSCEGSGQKTCPTCNGRGRINC